jgi:hypothetical protein
VPMAMSEVVGPSQVEGEAWKLKSTRTWMSVGTAASQFMEWPLHFRACQAMTVRSGCVFFTGEQQEWTTFEVAESDCWSQQERAADARSLSQQLPEWQASFTLLRDSSQLKSMPAARAWAIAKSGGCTPCLRAQASRSANVLQQQDRQHCSADWQPQLDDAQGNCSFDFCGRLVIVNGTPVAVMMNATSRLALIQLRMRGARFSN